MYNFQKNKKKVVKNENKCAKNAIFAKKVVKNAKKCAKIIVKIKYI